MPHLKLKGFWFELCTFLAIVFGAWVVFIGLMAVSWWAIKSYLAMLFG